MEFTKFFEYLQRTGIANFPLVALIPDTCDDEYWLFLDYEGMSWQSCHGVPFTHMRLRTEGATRKPSTGGPGD